MEHRFLPRIEKKAGSSSQKLGFIFAFCVCAATVRAQGLGFENETSFRSGYVWRGITLDRKPAVQSNNSITFGSLNFNLWSTGRTWRPAFQAGSDEVDFALSHESKIGPIGLSHSLTYYSYAAETGTKDSVEAGIGLTFDFAGLTLFTNQYLDVWSAAGGLYSEIGAAYEKEISSSWAIDTSLTLGWGSSAFNAYNLGVARSAWNVVACEIGFTYRLGGEFQVRPSLAASFLMDRHLRDAVGRPDNLIFGVSFGISR